MTTKTAPAEAPATEAAELTLPEPLPDLTVLSPREFRALGEQIRSAPRRDTSPPDISTAWREGLRGIDADHDRLLAQWLAEGDREFEAHHEATLGPLRTWRQTGQKSEPCDERWMRPEPEYVA